ncbi:MAG: hypothetical protein KGJ23_00470 [Euryarchaeota archaeon]|nr:hypothetical protein [Euryarchaeota archaeon]MDE1835070.1 hypothetical protein [Euryarchaeota archaeon]MDE1879341.1 hypothetical protein [Euryarchaeota archaeon]MDE2044968.1 hypothetical protein [Thermoplasmata archaeon]
MSAEDDAPRFRAHVQLLREATHGIGKDIEIEFKDVEKDIARLPHTIGHDYSVLHEEIEFKLARLSYKAHKSLKDFPKHVEEDLKKAGRAVKSGAKIAAEAPVVYTARGIKAAKKGAQKGFARAAGTYHDPLEEWNHPSEPNPK